MPAYAVLYILGGLIAFWGASLAGRGIAIEFAGAGFRQGLLRILGRGGGARTEHAAPLGDGAVVRRRVGILAGVVLVPLGLGIFVLGDYVLAWSAGGGFSWKLGSAWRSAAVLVVFAAGGVLLAGWKFDSAAGRQRCPRCWYDMAGLPTRRCPECGHEPMSESGLFRTRSSTGLIVCGAAMLVAAFFVERVPAWRAYGWRGFFPTTLLIGAFEWLPADLVIDTGTNRGYLEDRIDNGWEWQQEWLKSRCANIAAKSNRVRSLARAASLGEVDWRTTKESTICAILKQLEDKDSDTRQLAAQVIQRMRTSRHSPVDELVLSRAAMSCAPVLLNAINDKDADVRGTAWWLVPYLGDRADRLIPELMDRSRKWFDQKTPGTLGLSTDAATLVGLASTSDMALSVLLDEVESANGKYRLWILYHFRSVIRHRPEITGWLRNYLADPDDEVAGMAAYVLAFGDPPGVSADELLMLLQTRRQRAMMIRACYQVQPDPQELALLLADCIRSREPGSIGESLWYLSGLSENAMPAMSAINDLLADPTTSTADRETAETARNEIRRTSNF